VRPRLIAPFVVLLLAGAGAEGALAAHTETGPSWQDCQAAAPNAKAISGHVAKICYGDDEHRNKAGKLVDTYQVTDFWFTNRCSPKRGSRVPATMIVNKLGHFAYAGHGFTVVGMVVGMYRDPPKKISGTAQVVTTSCNSGAVAFSIRF
jgi:hypothetical protein